MTPQTLTILNDFLKRINWLGFYSSYDENNKHTDEILSIKVKRGFEYAKKYEDWGTEYVVQIAAIYLDGSKGEKKLYSTHICVKNISLDVAIITAIEKFKQQVENYGNI